MIVFPDVEALTVAYLREQIPGVSVSTAVPARRPDRFIRVTVNGGPDTSVVTSRTQIVVQCYDTDAVRASEMTRTAAAVMKAATGRRINGYPHVQRADKVGGPTRLDDPDLEGVARYQVVIEWLIRATH